MAIRIIPVSGRSAEEQKRLENFHPASNQLGDLAGIIPSEFLLKLGDTFPKIETSNLYPLTICQIQQSAKLFEAKPTRGLKPIDLARAIIVLTSKPNNERSACTTSSCEEDQTYGLV
jgi:hypothetical protein